jgi:predicted N-acetyltransferase YhbS
MTDAKVRQATVHDIPEMAEILTAVGLCRPEGLVRRLETSIAHGSALSFVAVSEGAMVGLALASFNGFHVFLSHIAVRPGLQMTGIGQALHASVHDRARELQAIGTITDSWLTSSPFFYKLGYRLPGVVFLIRDVTEPPAR